MIGLHKPDLLMPGDKVAVVATAGRVEKSYIVTLDQLLADWGLEVIHGENLFKKFHQFAGTDKERLSDLQRALDDPGIKAVFCARGGYGTIRIMESLSFNRFRKNPKWLVGFSDTTILHSKVHMLGFQSLHGPMSINLKHNAEPVEALWALLKTCLFKGEVNLTWKENELNIKGSAEGILTGGNLSILYSLLGTPYDLDTSEKILLIEDVGEHLYHLDRIMQSMRLAGKLEKLEALLVGSFTDMKDDKRPFGKTYQEIILDATHEFNFPVYFDFPAGHQILNYPVIFGMDYTIYRQEEIVILKSHH